MKTCGIHLPGHLPCRHCERARAATDKALAGVTPRAGGIGPSTRLGTPAAVEERVRELRASGMSARSVGAACGISETTVLAIVARSGRTVTARPADMAVPRPGLPRAARAAMPTPRARASYSRSS